jgi:hypothetical protein
VGSSPTPGAHVHIGIGVFAVAALLAVVGYLAIRGRVQQDAAAGSPEDVLTDEEFRRIEFGDDL